MNYFKKILSYGIPYIRFAFLNLFFNILYAIFSALAFIGLIPMIQILFDKTNKVLEKPEYNGIGNLKDYIENFLNYKLTYYINQDSSKALLFVIIIIISLFLLKNIFNYLALYFITFLRNGVIRDLRGKLYQKIVSLPVNFFSEKKKGDLIARVSSDILEIQQSFLSILELIVREPLTILFTLIIMFSISSNLTFFVLIFVPISASIISIIGKSLKKKSDKVQKEQGEFLSTVEETITGIKIIKAFNVENTFIKKFMTSINQLLKYSNELINRQNLASPISEFLGVLVIGVLLWYGGRMVLIDESIDGAVFIAYMGLAYNILTPAKGISKAYYSIKKGDAAAKRIIEILEIKDEMKNNLNAKELKIFNKEICFKNVSFSYGKNIILNDFSLTIKKGETIALVGPSGGGKTTMANLLNRFYDVDNGDIMIDGNSIKKISKKSLNDLIGLVTQDSILFNESVANNIALGDLNSSMEKIKKAAKMANAHEFIEELSDGYNTYIGDGGNKLSGGQKQRLSIARAILKNPEILILDEATSSLDSSSEKLVQNALEKLMINRTSVVIAHRLSTIKKANKIIVLDKGLIIEEGTHEFLINKDSFYKKLVELQNF